MCYPVKLLMWQLAPDRAIPKIAQMRRVAIVLVLETADAKGWKRRGS